MNPLFIRLNIPDWGRDDPVTPGWTDPDSCLALDLDADLDPDLDPGLELDLWPDSGRDSGDLRGDSSGSFFAAEIYED